MKKETLYEMLIPKDRNLNDIISKANESPDLVAHLISGINNPNTRIKFGCMNMLVKMSQNHAKKLYPHFDLFAGLLESDNKIYVLGSINILANLTKVDEDNKFDQIFDEYFGFLKDPSMTAAANVTKSSVTIVKNKPHLTNSIINRLLLISGYSYKTQECKDILIGQAINTFDKIFEQIEDTGAIFEFISASRNSHWSATRKKAEKFLNKHKAANIAI